jgi:hypothetical protein
MGRATPEREVSAAKAATGKLCLTRGQHYDELPGRHPSVASEQFGLVVRAIRSTARPRCPTEPRR